MKQTLIFSAVTILFLPLVAAAGETSKGTLIMMSSVGGWVSVAIALSLYRRSRRFRSNKKTALDKQ